MGILDFLKRKSQPEHYSEDNGKTASKNTAKWFNTSDIKSMTMGGNLWIYPCDITAITEKMFPTMLFVMGNSERIRRFVPDADFSTEQKAKAYLLNKIINAETGHHFSYCIQQGDGLLGMINIYTPDASKKQIKAGDAKDIYAAAAEIAVLRNMVKAEKGEKSTLTRKLSPEQMANLKEQIETLSKDPSFREMLNDEKTRSLVTSGHGGDFLDRVRRSEKNHPNMSKNASAILNSGTLGAHIEGLKKQASDLFTELNDELTRVRNAPEAERDMEKAWETIEKSKKLLAEYIACDNISRKPVKGAVNTEARLLQDVPASKISEQVSKRDSNQAFNDLTKGISPAKTLEILHNLATKSPDEVLRGLAEQEPILPAEKKAVPKQEVKQQEGPAVNLPNN